MEVVAYAGNDKENWGQIKALMNRLPGDRFILVKDRKTEGFPSDGKTEIVDIDSSKTLKEMKEDIMGKLRQKLSGDFEVALSIASGNGKEHMALISALLSLPVGIRLVVFTKNGIEFVN